MDFISITFVLNGTEYRRQVEPGKRLVDFLRQDMGCTSVKEGCGEGECGACTVIRNGIAVTACTVMAGQIDGDELVTVEGLAQSGELDALQQAFVDAGAVQCGYCTPGMILSAKALLAQNPQPGRDEIRRALSGNLCRCTGYTKIVAAVELARDRAQEEAV